MEYRVAMIGTSEAEKMNHNENTTFYAILLFDVPKECC